MKKQHLFLVLVFMVLTANAQIINIPDVNFKARLLAASPSNTTAASGVTTFIKIDSNNNNEIEVSEALQVTMLNVSISEIYDMTGIEYFTNLRTLNCDQNHISTLDLNNLSSLKSLYCNLNLLTALNLTGLTQLLNLECGENVLTQINFANALNIRTLICRFNFLTALNVNGLNNLQTLNFNYNQLTAINLSNLTQLTNLEFQSNQISTLDLTNSSNLSLLNCSYNQLAALDLTSLNALINLNCSHNQITSFGFANLIYLSVLNCEFNQINNPIVLNGLSDLNSIYCNNNLIPTLSFTDLPNLQIVDCSANQISDLDVSSLAVLSLLNCHNNPLLTHLNIKNGSNELFLDFSNNQNLQTICADEDQITAIENLIIEYGYTSCQVNSQCNLMTPNFAINSYFLIYPNPVKNVLNLKIKEMIDLKTLYIYNALGQIVMTIPNAKELSTISVTALKPGTYFIRMLTNKGNVSTKFVKD